MSGYGEQLDMFAELEGPRFIDGLGKSYAIIVWHDARSPRTEHTVRIPHDCLDLGERYWREQASGKSGVPAGDVVITTVCR